MRRYLLVALWPAGLAAIAAVTVAAARRGPAAPDRAAADFASDFPVVSSDWVADLVRLAAISGAGVAASYKIMELLGRPVVDHGLTIDEPLFRWTEDHRVSWWAAVMRRLNTVGNVWTTWGAAGAAAACLGVSWRQQRWLPPAALGAALLADHVATTRLHRKIRRPGPPPNPLGTYPAGGPDRIVLFSGLIAYLLWREFSGSRRGKACATGAVAALAFSQAYCRQYLSQHWFIDIVCGLVYGALLLGPFIAAVRLIAGPAAAGAAPGQADVAPILRRVAAGR